jgi:hypothetical protein
VAYLPDTPEGREVLTVSHSFDDLSIMYVDFKPVL